MVCVDGYGDGADSGHSIGQSLLVSSGYEPVVSDVSHCQSAVVEARLRVLSAERNVNDGLEARGPLTVLKVLKQAASPLTCRGRCLSTAARC